MNSEEPKTPGILKHLPVFEKVLMCVLAIGIILAVLNINFLILRIALTGLAVTFFLSAYRPPEEIKERSENDTFGFSEMLALMIIPKVLWISSAVSAAGIALYFFRFGNDGYKQALMIGILSIAACLVLLAFFLISGIKHLKSVTPILLRAVPALLAGLYFFFN